MKDNGIIVTGEAMKKKQLTPKEKYKNSVLYKPDIYTTTEHSIYKMPVRYIVRDSGLVEDQCEHGVGHPNRKWLYDHRKDENVDGLGIHGCDGCCQNLALTHYTRTFNPEEVMMILKWEEKEHKKERKKKVNNK